MANFTSSPSVGDEIVKGVNRYRFNGVGWTPVSRTTVAGSLAVTQIKWEFKLTAGQTAITGTDSNGLLLDYDTNAEVEVFYNGIKIVEGSSEDYVLTSSTVLTIVGSGIKLNDEVEIVQRSRFTAADYYTKTELDTSLAGKIDDAQVLTNVPVSAVFTDTVYSKPSNEPISYVTGLQTALNAKTTEAYVDGKITTLIGSAPAALDTLQELGDALGDDANYAATMTTALSGKVDDGQVLTDVPSGAVFTDTVYSKPSAESIGYITNLQTELNNIKALALAGL